MADSDDTKAEASAEKAYAAAAEAVGEKDEIVVPTAEVASEPVEFPAKPKRARKAPAVAAAEPGRAPVAAEAPAPIAEAAPAEILLPAAPAPKPRRMAANPLKTAKAVKTAKPVAKLAVKRAVAKPVAAPAAKPAAIKPLAIKVRKPAVQKIKTAPKAAANPVEAGIVAATKTSFIDQLKEIPMDMTTSIKDAVSGAQDKAKEAFTKTSAAASEYGEFAKGNVEAVVESGKILASGLQELGNKFIADSKTAFETASADVKALTSVKSPTEFFQFQTDLLKRNFETAVSYGTKTSEAMLKLSGDVIKPISGRVTLAVEKVKAAA